MNQLNSHNDNAIRDLAGGEEGVEEGSMSFHFVNVGDKRN